MFVISSIQKEYIGEIIVQGNDGMSHFENINRTNINFPINLQNVTYFKKGFLSHEHAPSYQIVFQFQRFTASWDYFKEEARDTDYEKLLSLNSIGVMCQLKDIE